MTGTEALSRLEEIGARIVLLPDGALDVTAPAGPETEALVHELAAHKPEAVAVLRGRAAPLARMPQDVGERQRRLDRTRREKRAGLLATPPRVTRTATGPTRSTPSQTSPDGSAA